MGKTRELFSILPTVKLSGGEIKKGVLNLPTIKMF